MPPPTKREKHSGKAAKAATTGRWKKKGISSQGLFLGNTRVVAIDGGLCCAQSYRRILRDSFLISRKSVFSVHGLRDQMREVEGRFNDGAEFQDGQEAYVDGGNDKGIGFSWFCDMGQFCMFGCCPGFFSDSVFHRFQAKMFVLQVRGERGSVFSCFCLTQEWWGLTKEGVAHKVTHRFFEIHFHHLGRVFRGKLGMVFRDE